MIPRIIHYCWFGPNKLPEQLVKYMESWKLFCPDYEI
ncbi:glycosyl transferase, partial [Acinetobacter baumannii]